MSNEICPLLILGSGTFAVEIADVISEIPGFKVCGFVQSVDPRNREAMLEGLPVYWITEIARLAGSHRAVCAVGSTQRSGFIGQAAALGIRFVTAVHPSAHISCKSSLGEGTIISAGAVIGAHTKVGRHVIVNRGALIGHHTEIGDCVTVGPGANIAGSCRVGEATFVGIGAIISDHVEIGANAFVGAGTVVTKDVAPNTMVAAARTAHS